ncbi:DUF6414 family protein [Halomicrococcus gelatinilyticus]|uniref:DUF6414 family protein n=1 Tax=Halomicrococcus gelatinilyticus TaxID=1702103 RepID=UPI002E10DACC
MEDTPTVDTRVPGFVYLDMDRVKSISARIDQGYIQERVKEQEESEELATSVYGSIKAHILGSVGPSAETGAEVNAGFASGSRLQETKALHHYYYDLLEQWLAKAEGDWFHNVNLMKEGVGGGSALPSRFRNEVEEGDIIKVSGELNFSDFNTSVELMDGFFDMIELLEEFQTEAVRKQLTGDTSEVTELSEVGEFELQKFKPAEPIFNALKTVLPNEYRQMLITELSPISDNDFTFWATVERDNLETTPVEFLSKYQSNDIENCTMLARVENITSELDEEEQASLSEIEEGEDVEIGKFLNFAGELGSQFGLAVKYPKVSVSPIAIYR